MPTPTEETFDDAMSGSGNEKHSARVPACDLCREKKVRCGREKPKCNNCVAWKASCTYSERQKRDNEASRNAARFEEVNDRLDRIEGTMARLVTALETAQLHSTPVSPPGGAPSSVLSRPRRCPTPDVATKNILVPNGGGDMMQYLGPSSLLSITSEAETLLQERLKASTAPGGGAAGRTDQSEAMGALRKLSSISSKMANFFPHYGHKELRSGAETAGMGKPPREETDLLVNEFFSKIHHWFPIFDEAQFRQDLDGFYKDPEILGKDRAWLVCFNNVLLFGLHNQLATMTAEEKMKYIDLNDKRVSQFFFNAWSAIDDLEVFIAPRLRNIQALMSASVCAIEVSRPGLCWSLLSQAASTAKAIGLHRKSAPSKLITRAQMEERKYVFWNVYILDKCLSLSFGRSPCLPDYDCDVEIPELDESRPFCKSFLALLALARVQSEIYVRLYSASASQLSEEEREHAIKDLDTELRVWWDEWSQIFADPRNSAVDTFEHIELQFSYHNSMTLVHRMARPGMPSYGWSDEECLENSRAAIRMVNSVVAEGSEVASSGMLLWLFQYYPFTSFFVLFSAIIRNPSAPTSSSVDYALMKALVAYLSQMKGQNEGAAKLLSIASAFTHVAGTFLKNYLKMTKQQQPRGAQPQKRRREEPAPPPVKDMWVPKPQAYFTSTRGTPPQISQTPPQPFTPTPSTSTDSEVEAPASVDLQQTSFLRWPQTSAPLEPVPAINTDGQFDIDLEALMAEPGGFQMQMAQEATMRGPLEFDWFSWDGQFGM